MDELVIEGRKYISSKRAAQETGYAKDYVGQLCREGRVPARLVGRNWYVLEAAMHDHRFGVDPREQKIEHKGEQRSAGTNSWETPHYEAIEAEVLPTINRLAKSPDEQPEPKHVEQSSVALDEAWQEWFAERAPLREPAVADISSTLPASSHHDLEERSPIASQESPEEAVPLHIQQKSRQAALAQPEAAPARFQKNAVKQAPQDQTKVVKNVKISRKPAITLWRFGASFLLISAFTGTALAFMGSGYFDTYIIQSQTASLVSGMSMYKK